MLLTERHAHPIRSIFSGINKKLEQLIALETKIDKAYNEKKAEYETEKAATEIKIREYQEQLQIVEDSEHELELMKSDQNYAIKRLMKENPELLENEEFVLDLIDVSMEYIALDKTDSANVYSVFLSKASEILEEFKKQVEGDDIDQHCIQGSIESINYCLVELKNPQLVSNDKYKIPHKFLYEALRRMALIQPEEMQERRMADSIASICRDYEKFDGKCDYTSGKKLEELYMDENTDLYLHVIMWQFSDESKYSSIVNRINRDGLILNSMYNNRMDRTTVAQNQLSGHFFQFLESTRNAHEIILCIPKNESMILGNNTNANDTKYILPEYVVGEMTQNKEGEIEFIENPIPVSERTVYEHKYMGIKVNDIDGKISPITAVKNALSQGTTLDETMQAATIDSELSTDKTYNRRRGVTKDD